MRIPDGIYYIVLADLVGSTSYMTKMGNDAGVARLHAFEGAAKQALAYHKLRNSGVFVKTVGDAVLLAFNHFPDVVQWHLEFDGVLVSAPPRTESMNARVLLHVGELRFEDGNLNGLAVSQLCKIEQAAKRMLLNQKKGAGNLILTHLAKEIAQPALFPVHCVLESCPALEMEGHSPVLLYQLVVKEDLGFLFDKQNQGKPRRIEVDEQFISATI